MNNFIALFASIVISGLSSSCSTSTHQQGTVYNPQTQEAEQHNYTPFYQLKTEIIPARLKIELVTQIHKETLPGAYSIKKYTRRLLPNDYMAQSNTTIYLSNLSNQTIELDLIAISIEQKKLPFSTRRLVIPASENISLPLGDISIDLRLNTLNTRIEYVTDGIDTKKEHKEEDFDMLRNIEASNDGEKKQGDK